MKDKYIREVEKLLPLPSRAKKEVLRDLNEIFESAAEHGESEKQVIQRLGSPEEFIRNLNEQIDLENFSKEHKRKKSLLIILCIFMVSVACFGIYAVLKAMEITEIAKTIGIIGGADGPTAIFVTSSGPDFQLIAILLGGILLVTAIVLLIRYLLKHHQKKD